MPVALPIDAVLPELLAALRASSNVVLQAPTGAGKTTRVPPALIDAGYERVIMLEPRRLAARAATSRIAFERGSELGREVGYHVRFERRCQRDTRILVVTPGILLRMLHDDPYLERINAVLFDEFHERGLECDVALGLLRLLQQTIRPELRLLAMSATLAGERIAAYLDDAPIVTSEGRLFPVEIRHEAKPDALDWPDATAAALERLWTQTPGDLLAFLPGMAEIRRTAALLERPDRMVLPLHGDLPAEQQDLALRPQRQRRIVLSTNVAETSVTVEGVTGVVDSGLARVMVYDAHLGLDRLELQPISLASAAQRSGRAGRTQPGIAVRLWSVENQRTRPEHTLAEIARVDLAGALLTLFALGESDVSAFPWLDAPSAARISQAVTLLERLGFVESNQLTLMGQQAARLPVHPRLARMLLHGSAPLASVALAGALLSERSPFMDGAPGDFLEQLRRVEQAAPHGRGDGLHLGGTLAILRVRDQLLRSLRDDGETFPDGDAEAGIAQALLSGFPDRLARRRDPGGRTGVMVGGRGVRLSPACVRIDTELFLALDVDAGDRESYVRQAIAIEREWLPAAQVITRIEFEFDAKTERVIGRKRTRFDDLLLDEVTVPVRDDDQTAAILTDAALADLERVLPSPDSEAGQWLLRLECLREWLPHPDWPIWEREDWEQVLSWLTPGCRSFDDLRNRDWSAALQGRLSREQVAVMEREAPERWTAPTGSRIALQYERGRPPVLAVRIQELFGLTESPRVGGGRIKVLMHLLAPNYRPQQVTDDLAGFWVNTYPLVRKEMRIRYPRHAWPDDPLNADPESRPRRRTPPE